MHNLGVVCDYRIMYKMCMRQNLHFGDIPKLAVLINLFSQMGLI